MALNKHFSLPTRERHRLRPPLDENIWIDSSVQTALHSLFCGKCAYCESPLTSTSAENIEHHRPIGNAQNFIGKSDELSAVDHYSWLAYEWRNLFLACMECGRSKRNVFPVDGPRTPLQGSWEDAQINERPILINPCQDEPRRHLSFLMNGKVEGTDNRGHSTVKVLDLNREHLIRERRTKFETCVSYLYQGRQNRLALDDFRDELAPDSPYSGAAQNALFRWFKRYADEYRGLKPTFTKIVDHAIRVTITLTEKEWNDLTGLPDKQELYVYEYTALPDDDSSTPPLIEKKALATAQLKHIAIRNFKGITSLDLDLSKVQSDETGAPCAMLLGENSTGKSTTLQAIALALMGQKSRDALRESVDQYLPRKVSGWELSGTESPEVKLEFDTGEHISLRIDPLSLKFIGEDEPPLVLYAYGSRRFFGSEATRRQSNAHVKSLFDPFAKIQHPGRWLQELRDHEFDAVARAMREVLVLGENDRIDRDDEKRVYVRAHGRDTPLERLSDGYRSLIAMVLDVMRGMIDAWGNLEQARGLVLIDEIETHLHPQWKLRVMTALRSAMPMVQFIATTHDPLCLRGMLNGEVQVLVRNDEHEIQVLEDLPDVRGLRAEQLLTSDYFGLQSTADPLVEIALERLAIPKSSSSVKATQADTDAILPLQWIGDTQEQQILNEALRRYNNERRASVHPSMVKEAAVHEVLKLLRERRPGGEQ